MEVGSSVNIRFKRGTKRGDKTGESSRILDSGDLVECLLVHIEDYKRYVNSHVMRVHVEVRWNQSSFQETSPRHDRSVLLWFERAIYTLYSDWT